ncbi:hypothetical protein C0J52_10873 [Blattella germanica]|nr:hypothetical protein C0J52_10873 [Blattella germanica]
MKMAPSAKYNRSKGLDSQQIVQVLDEIFADEDSGDTDIMMNEQSDNDVESLATENNAIGNSLKNGLANGLSGGGGVGGRRESSGDAKGEFDDLISALRTGDVFGEDMAKFKRSRKSRLATNGNSPPRMNSLNREDSRERVLNNSRRGQ